MVKFYKTVKYLGILLTRLLEHLAPDTCYGEHGNDPENRGLYFPFLGALDPYICNN